MSGQLTIALTKGRILADELDLLAKAGIQPTEDPSLSRKLVFDTNQADIRIMVLRGMDVATYVDHGIADVGMSGKDVLLEHAGTGFHRSDHLDLVYSRLDLGVYFF